MKILRANRYTAEIKELLETDKLPFNDLPEDLSDFYVAIKDNNLIGCVGLEHHGDYGLLRSLVIGIAYRDLGIAGKLLNKIEELAFNKGLHRIYLLTETASSYFSSKGFMQISRADIPVDVQNSAEFTHVCPQLAVAMEKTIR